MWRERKLQKLFGSDSRSNRRESSDTQERGGRNPPPFFSVLSLSAPSSHRRVAATGWQSPVTEGGEHPLHLEELCPRRVRRTPSAFPSQPSHCIAAESTQGGCGNKSPSFLAQRPKGRPKTSEGIGTSRRGRNSEKQLRQVAHVLRLPDLTLSRTRKL